MTLRDSITAQLDQYFTCYALPDVPEREIIDLLVQLIIQSTHGGQPVAGDDVED